MGTYVPLRWVKTTEVAKLIRAYLKQNYPGQKFSVRSDSYSGGSAVRVETPPTWTREQTSDLYRELAPWGSRGFDGMTDSSYGKGHTICPVHFVTLTSVGSYWGHDAETMEPCCDQAEPVNMGASYVSVQHGGW
jgi:hypothetical protein